MVRRNVCTLHRTPTVTSPCVVDCWERHEIDCRYTSTFSNFLISLLSVLGKLHHVISILDSWNFVLISKAQGCF